MEPSASATLPLHILCPPLPSYRLGFPMNLAIDYLPDAARSDPTGLGPHVAIVLCGGNVFNGYIVYELVWELVFHGLANPANLYHHIVFLVLAGGFCSVISYSYLGMSFMVMELSTIPLKVRRLSFRKHYTAAQQWLKTTNTVASVLFAVTFFLTRIAHAGFAMCVFYGWIADGSLEGYSPGPKVDVAVGVGLAAVFVLQGYWFTLILGACIGKKKKGKKNAE
jgi:hypothetical protein